MECRLSLHDVQQHGDGAIRCDAPLTAASLLTLSVDAKPLSAFWAGA